ncbi:MAG: hypothetical protein IH607_00970, partial [Firmicutes bacterium]|nr:hypothetical protein [Bacillota bacterium]
AIDICQQNLYLSQSPRTHRSMYIAVFFACINLFGLALANAVGGYLMQTPFAALSLRLPLVLGMEFTKMHWMILTTIILRIVVLLIFLPRIHEDGAQTLSGTVKGITSNTTGQVQRRISAIRNSMLRKHIRRHLQKEAFDAGQQSK